MDSINDNYRDDEIDLGELVQVLWYRKWFIIVFVISVSIVSSFFIAQIPNIYQSNVLIMFEKSSVSNDPIQSLLSGSITSAGNTETELELIRGRRFSSQIVDGLSLYNEPEFKVVLPENSRMAELEFEELKRKNAINIVSNNIFIQQKPGTKLISISYQSKNPELAALIANEIGTKFVSFKHELMMGKYSENSKLINDKVESVLKNLEQAELNITQYQNKHDFVDIKSAKAFSHTKLSKFHAQKQTLDNKIEQSNILINHITRSERDVDALLAIPMLVTSSIVNAGKQELITQQKSFDKIKLKYGTRHPSYIEENRLLNDAKSNLLFEIDKQISQIDKQLEIYKDNLFYLEKQIEIHTLRLRQLGVIDFDYQKLKREFDGYLSLYGTLVEKQNESDLMQDLTNTSNTILVERAEVNNTPVQPKRKLMLVLAILGSLMVSALLVFIEMMLGDRTTQLKRVANKFGTKVIGTIPKIKIRKSDKRDVLTHINRQRHSGFVEAIRTIRTNILLDRQLSKQKVIAITSINPNDGKSSLSIQLADCFSELERVVLVDADLRFPSIAKALGENPSHPGLTNLISQSHTFEQSIIKQDKYNFEVIASGDVPNNPLVLLSNPRLEKILDSIKETYDRAILECPPIMSVSDAYVISKHVDSVYLVIDAEKTNASTLTNVLQELRQANVDVGGILINKVKQSNTYYSTKYYGRRNDDEPEIKPT
jgi:capsular exopolysaccharide synthesis family protein